MNFTGKIEWQNYVEMGDDADIVRTDDRFRHLHGEELVKAKALYPGLKLEDDFFTDVDKEITEALSQLFPAAKIRNFLSDSAFEEDGLEKMVWELRDLSEASVEDLNRSLTELSKKFPKIRFCATWYEEGSELPSEGELQTEWVSSLLERSTH